LFWLFFLHAELQDPQIEKHAKNNTKTGHSIKHVLKQQTEVQFVVFAYLVADGVLIVATDFSGVTHSAIEWDITARLTALVHATASAVRVFFAFECLVIARIF
jgi:hypothetical protein